MQLDSGVHAALPVCSILLGFLFAGFWWTLNRELTFKVEDRHFKLGIGLLLVAMVMLWSCLDYSELCCPCEQSLMRIPPFFWTIEG